MAGLKKITLRDNGAFGVGFGVDLSTSWAFGHHAGRAEPPRARVYGADD